MLDQNEALLIEQINKFLEVSSDSQTEISEQLKEMSNYLITKLKRTYLEGQDRRPILTKIGDYVLALYYKGLEDGYNDDVMKNLLDAAGYLDAVTSTIATSGNRNKDFFDNIRKAGTELFYASRGLS